LGEVVRISCWFDLRTDLRKPRKTIHAMPLQVGGEHFRCVRRQICRMLPQMLPKPLENPKLALKKSAAKFK
jgi:hypothetical protein